MTKSVDIIGKDENVCLDLENVKYLKYGENPHQIAGLYKLKDINEFADFEVYENKELSYNNFIDMSKAVDIVSEFFDVNAVVFVKHHSPCGVALGQSLRESFNKAFDCDPISALGATIAFSKNVTKGIAKLLEPLPLESVIAPSFADEAVEILKEKSSVKLIKLNTSLKDYRAIKNDEIKVTPFGVLVQTPDIKDLEKDTFKVVTKLKPTQEQIEDAIFAWKVAKHAKSNAIVIVKDFKTLAISQGETNRVWAIEHATDYACDGAKEAVLASDGNLSIDNVHVAVQGRISFVICPEISSEVIKEADKYNLIVITTGIRNFKH